MSESLFSETASDGVCPKCGAVHEGGSDCPTRASGGKLAPPRRKEDKLIGTTLAEHFEIISLIGQGGMSVVYKARHTFTHNIRAIKLLREHLVDRSTNLARFQLEAQAAMHLTHPNIIAVHDYGMTADEQPYLIMDYLEGESLGELIQKQKRLPVDRALAVFSQICDALGFAHQKGVLHRDIKPSNVMLVKDGDKTDCVKLVDFGIAKLMPGGELEGQRLTATGEVFGSPVYMSPEQCTGQVLDTRSDIYSMGCVMYEALCGHPPFVGSNPLETMYLRLQEPPAPFPPELSIPRSLEHIVLITLAREPEQRYQSMAELKAEIDRVRTGTVNLTNLIDTMRRSVRLSQARKATKKVQLEAYFAVVALLMMVAGFYSFRLLSGTASPWESQGAVWKQYYDEGQKAFDRGELGQAEKNMMQAVAEAQKFGEMDRRLVSSLEKLASIYKTEGKQSQLEDTAARIEAIKQKQSLEETEQSDRNVNELADLTLSLCPKVIEKDKWSQYAQLTEKLNHLGVLLINQQSYDRAEQLLKKALEIEKTTLGPDSPNVARTMRNLAALYDTKKGQFKEALPLYEQAVAIKAKALGKDHPDVADGLSDLAAIYREQGQYEKAEQLYNQALAIYQRAYGMQHPHVARNLTGLADIYRIEGQFPKAEKLYKQALNIYVNTQGMEHSTVAMSYANLAGLYLNEGKYGPAEQMYSEALSLYEKIQGPESLSVATVVNNLAAVYFREGKYKDAEPMFKRALAIRERLLAADHPEIAQSLNNVAEVYRLEGRYEDAEPLYKRALKIDEKSLGQDHPEVAVVLNSLGQLYTSEGKLEQAEEYYKRALAVRQKSFGDEHPEVANTLNELAKLYAREGKYEESEKLFQKTLAMREKTLGPEHPDVAQTLNDYSDLLTKVNRSSDALKLRSRSFSIWLRSLLPSA